MKTSKKENKITEEKYTKNQIIKSKTFIDNKDLLNELETKVREYYSFKNTPETKTKAEKTTSA